MYTGSVHLLSSSLHKYWTLAINGNITHCLHYYYELRSILANSISFGSKHKHLQFNANKYRLTFMKKDGKVCIESGFPLQVSGSSNLLCTPHITNSNNNIIIAATGIAVQTYTKSSTMHLSFGIPMDLKGESQISVNL